MLRKTLKQDRKDKEVSVYVHTLMCVFGFVKIV